MNKCIFFSILVLCPINHMYAMEHKHKHKHKHQQQHLDRAILQAYVKERGMEYVKAALCDKSAAVATIEINNKKEITSKQWSVLHYNGPRGNSIVVHRTTIIQKTKNTIVEEETKEEKSYRFSTIYNQKDLNKLECMLKKKKNNK